MIYMTFLGGVLGPFLQEKEQEAGPKHPIKKSYRSYFRRAQIRWVIWPSSKPYKNPRKPYLPPKSFLCGPCFFSDKEKFRTGASPEAPMKIPFLINVFRLSAPQRCNAERSGAQRNFFTSQFIPPFLQRHRCDALPCFSASPVKIVYIAHIAFPPLLPFFLSPQWFTVQNNKTFTESHNAAMSPLATRDGHRKRKRKRSDAVH